MPISSDQNIFKKLNPDKGSFVSSFGPKGTGKSELNTRLFISFPYNGLLVDFTRDVDPQHQFTMPMTPELRALARELEDWKGEDLSSLDDFSRRVKIAWTQNGKFRYAKYQVVPNFVSDDWLEKNDIYIGLAYLAGKCFIFLDEIGELAPASKTPRWTRIALRVGRHQQLSIGMAGPRPADLDTNVLNQSDMVTVHGQLHERDVSRMAKQLALSESQLLDLIDELRQEERDGVDVNGYLAYVKKTREIFVMPPLPPRKK